MPDILWLVICGPFRVVAVMLSLPIVLDILWIGPFIRLVLLPAVGFAFVMAFDSAFAFYKAVAKCFLILLPPQIQCLFEI